MSPIPAKFPAGVFPLKTLYVFVKEQLEFVLNAVIVKSKKPNELYLCVRVVNVVMFSIGVLSPQSIEYPVFVDVVELVFTAMKLYSGLVCVAPQFINIC